MTWVTDIDSLHDFIGYVVLYAPDRFPLEDYLAADEQMTLEQAFDELRRGMSFIDPEVADEHKLRKLSSLLEESLAAYRSGDEAQGAQRLHDFEALIFKTD